MERIMGMQEFGLIMMVILLILKMLIQIIIHIQ